MMDEALLDTDTLSEILKARNATVVARTKFEHFCGQSQVLPVTERIFDEAAALWAIARQGGFP